MRLWSVVVKPEAFRLLAGEAALTDYSGRNPGRCGVRPFERIDAPNMTNETCYNINVACLDGVDIDEPLTAPVTYCDGLNDNWGEIPVEVWHL
ncbi:hypothetical protein BHMPCIPO_02566 [Ensifer sesbaniae]|nr:hypothetical protein [Ensifer sesbaniae]